jgi:hypothetical protein
MGWGMTHEVEHLPNVHESLGAILNTANKTNKKTPSSLKD